MKTAKILGAKCVLLFEYYPNHTISIEAYLRSNNELWIIPTVNWESNYVGGDYAKTFQFPTVVIKDYGENEGVYKQLISAGVILPGKPLSASPLSVYSATLTESWQQIATRQLEAIKNNDRNKKIDS